MGTKRKLRSAQLKAQVAMAAVAGGKMPANPAPEYGVHPMRIGTWKQGLVTFSTDGGYGRGWRWKYVHPCFTARILSVIVRALF